MVATSAGAFIAGLVWQRTQTPSAPAAGTVAVGDADCRVAEECVSLLRGAGGGYSAVFGWLVAACLLGAIVGWTASAWQFGSRCFVRVESAATQAPRAVAARSGDVTAPASVNASQPLAIAPPPAEGDPLFDTYTPVSRRR